MFIKIASDMDSLSIEGVEYRAEEGYVELPDNLERGTLKYLLEQGFKQVPDSKVPDKFKTPQLPPSISDAHYPANFAYYGKKGSGNNE
ncbi:MAG: hypothetical protein ABSH41_14080 [Syntrophobacteraceae bacterium]|jgi:hypothetical protein